VQQLLSLCHRSLLVAHSAGRCQLLLLAAIALLLLPMLLKSHSLQFSLLHAGLLRSCCASTCMASLSF